MDRVYKDLTLISLSSHLQYMRPSKKLLFKTTIINLPTRIIHCVVAEISRRLRLGDRGIAGTSKVPEDRLEEWPNLN